MSQLKYVLAYTGYINPIFIALVFLALGIMIPYASDWEYYSRFMAIFLVVMIFIWTMWPISRYIILQRDFSKLAYLMIMLALLISCASMFYLDVFSGDVIMISIVMCLFVSSYVLASSLAKENRLMWFLAFFLLCYFLPIGGFFINHKIKTDDKS